jgi:hypothetical protein
MKKNIARLSVDMTREQMDVYSIAAKKLKLLKSDLVRLALDKYIKSELTDKMECLEIDIINLKLEIKAKETMLKAL